MKTKSIQLRISAFSLCKFAVALVCGAFLVLSASAQNYAIIKSFSPQVLDGVTGINTNSDGMYPSADVIISGQTIYGTATEGGTGGGGTVFKINFDGSGFAVLHNFAPSILDSTISNSTNSDGSSPAGKLLLLGNTLYGTTKYSGTKGGGTIFSVDTNGNNFTLLTNLTANGANGAFPSAGLVSPDGSNLFGTTTAGGASGGGVLFKISTNGNNYSIIHQFNLISTNGYGPYGQMIFAGTNLYGTTYAEGASNDGCIYKISTNGVGFALIKSFSTLVNSTNSDGGEPYGRLLLSSNVFYGTTFAGGAYSNGVIFRINTDGTGFTNLHSFNTVNYDGAQPKSALTIAGPTLYGTTPAGGAAGAGTIFYINTDGTDFGTLRTFGVTSPYDGTVPNAGFALSGATFWSVAQYGGTNGTGTIYRYQWHNTPPPSIARSGNNVILSWYIDDSPNLTNDFNFTLQATPSLTNGVWTNVSPAPVIVNNFWNTVTNTATAPSQFYRISPF